MVCPPRPTTRLAAINPAEAQVAPGGGWKATASPRRGAGAPETATMTASPARIVGAMDVVVTVLFCRVSATVAVTTHRLGE